MRADLIGIFMCAFLAGGLLTFLGGVIKHFNAGNMINLFDDKKHDKDKVSRVVGRNFLFTGLSTILIAVISIFINEVYYNYVMMMQLVLIIVGLMATFYQFNKYCKK
ncbi:DUF3784 domain-containing protein [Hathewaya histolytica]|uniref:DUF3784 domain-containing protein n=1 Tax=Hathewaya histolytica TaxID=1498 RepID=A0A4U9R976_HATHI|nr:DUF3784 domain-containing protein [Hathewaya histolytica]VTQ85240.1 Uncharacterised protein [Hathewaya histolytica]